MMVKYLVSAPVLFRGNLAFPGSEGSFEAWMSAGNGGSKDWRFRPQRWGRLFFGRWLAVQAK
jgi:hypothetical protein